MIKRTSDGLRDLLIRHGVSPTMDSKKDVELGRKFMPITYKTHLEEVKKMTDLYKSNKLFDLHAELMKESKSNKVVPKVKKIKRAKNTKSKKAKTLEDVKLLSLDDVVKVVFYSKASIYRLMDEGKFPKPITLGGRSVFWVQSEIIDFMQKWIDQPR